MTLDEFNKLSKDESFERIKEESRSKAKRMVCYSLMAMFFIVALTIGMELWGYENNVISISWAVFFCFIAGWIGVNNFRLFRRVDNLDTPEQLLHGYEKTIRNDRNACYVGILVGVFDPYLYVPGDKAWNVMWLVIIVAAVVFLVYSFYHEYWEFRTRRDEEIIDRLHDLIGMK